MPQDHNPAALQCGGSRSPERKGNTDNHPPVHQGRRRTDIFRQRCKDEEFALETTRGMVSGNRCRGGSPRHSSKRCQEGFCQDPRNRRSRPDLCRRSTGMCKWGRVPQARKQGQQRITAKFHNCSCRLSDRNFVIHHGKSYRLSISGANHEVLP